MKTLIILALSFIFFHFSNTEKEFNAGVMPYAIDESGEVFILLGEEDGYWEDFIGRPEDKDKMNPIETAVREFIEETNCYFNKDEIKSKIQKSVPLKLNESTIRYIIKIQKIDKTKLLDNNTKCDDVEKTNYCWILATELLKAIDIAKDDKHVYVPSECNGKTNKLHKQMRKNLLIGSESRIQIEAILDKMQVD